MKTATISDAKNRLSELLARVKRGETVLILERDQPIARIVPIELERTGVLRRPVRKPGSDMLGSLPPMPTPASSALAALLAEREEGR